MLDEASARWDETRLRMQSVLEDYLADDDDDDEPFVFGVESCYVQGYKLEGGRLYIEAASGRLSEVALSDTQRDYLSHLGWTLEGEADENQAEQP